MNAASRSGDARLSPDDADANATVSVGMAIALGALAMTFAAILLAYAIVRVQATTWPPPGESGPPPLWPWPAAATWAALAGSAGMFRTRRTVVALAEPGAPLDPSRAKSLTRSLAATTLFGAVFIGIQACGWLTLVRAGFRPDSGLVASVVFALTVFHALHAFAALIFILPLVARALRRQPIRLSSVAAVSSFWHLVTIVWLVVCLAVFVA